MPWDILRRLSIVVHCAKAYDATLPPGPTTVKCFPAVGRGPVRAHAESWNPTRCRGLLALDRGSSHQAHMSDGVISWRWLRGSARGRGGHEKTGRPISQVRDLCAAGISKLDEVPNFELTIPMGTADGSARAHFTLSLIPLFNTITTSSRFSQSSQ